MVRPGGHLVTLQAPPSSEQADRYGITATFFVVTADRAQLMEIGAMIQDGRLRITVADSYPLADGRLAYLSGSRADRAPGKTVLLVRQ